MEQIRLKSNHLVSNAPDRFVRAISNTINWDDRLIGLLGESGVGKTTLLLQTIKKKYGINPEALYISFNDFYLAGSNLFDFALEFHSKGGKLLAIDDIHKYAQWSADLKKVYDSIPDLQIIYAGASTIELVKHYANLTQRATIHHLNGLSFREFIAFNGIAELPVYDLNTLLQNHQSIAREISNEVKPLIYFDRYLTKGYYPFSDEGYEIFKRQLEDVLSKTIESNMAYMDSYDPRNAYKMKQLLHIIAQNAPFKPNLVKISDTIGVHRNTLIGYLFLLEKAKLINLLYPSGSIISILQKPERVYLSNPNLSHLLCESAPSRDALAYTFAVNQLKANYQPKITDQSAIDVDGKWMVTVETNKKTAPRILKQPNTFAFVDGLETGSDKRIPLWMLGLTY